VLLVVRFVDKQVKRKQAPALPLAVRAMTYRRCLWLALQYVTDCPAEAAAFSLDHDDFS
jgi:hypothetical protein